jgi:hypothetical protein
MGVDWDEFGERLKAAIAERPDQPYESWLDALEINTAFGAHGLRSLGVKSTDLGVQPPSQTGFHVSIEVAGARHAAVEPAGRRPHDVVLHPRADGHPFARPVEIELHLCVDDVVHVPAAALHAAAGGESPYRAVIPPTAG